MIIEIEQNGIVTFYTVKRVQTSPHVEAGEDRGYIVQLDKVNHSVPKGGTITVRTDHGKTMRVLGLKPAKDQTTVLSLSERNRAIMEVLRPGDKVRIERGVGYLSEVQEVQEVSGRVRSTLGTTIRVAEITQINNEPV